MVVLFKVLAFFGSPIGKIVGIAIAVAGSYGATYIKGYSDGKANIQSKWDAAELAAIENARRARVDSERIGPDGLSDDRHRRD